jgi:hypothetical protein
VRAFFASPVLGILVVVPLLVLLILHQSLQAVPTSTRAYLGARRVIFAAVVVLLVVLAVVIVGRFHYLR